MTDGAEETWLHATTTDQLEREDRVVVELVGRSVVLFWNGGAPVAMDDACIHKQRSLAKGFLLNGRIVCPGHQWAFDLTTGFCRERDRFQPVHEVSVEGDAVRVNAASVRRAAEEATPQG